MLILTGIGMEITSVGTDEDGDRVKRGRMQTDLNKALLRNADLSRFLHHS